MEGLFKPHTNSSLVQHYKNQFDNGVDVEFNRTNDAGTVAQLLLMFFEELPDPLLTYELFPLFVEFAKEPPSPGITFDPMGKEESNLTPCNR